MGRGLLLLENITDARRQCPYILRVDTNSQLKNKAYITVCLSCEVVLMKEMT